VLLLGFVSMIIFGALYQLLPVITGLPLYSKILPKWTCAFLTAGTLLLGYAFWIFNTGLLMEIAALLVLAAVTMHAVNVLRTVKNAKSSETLDCIATAHIWLLATVLLGTLLVFNFRFAFLPQDQLHYLGLHAHLGLAGWLLLLIIGVASRLIPMFMLAAGNMQPIRIAYYTINTALCLFLADLLFTHSYDRSLIYVLVAAAGIAAFCWFMRDVAKRSVRKKSDESMIQTFAAVVFLLIPLELAILNVIPVEIFDTKQQLSLTTVYGISLLPGFLVMLILGQTFKTLPFILWVEMKHKFRLPPKFMPRDLYHSRPVAFMHWTWNAGILLLIAGELSAMKALSLVAASLLVIAVCLYLLNLLFMLRKRNFPLHEKAEK
jgi:hypothetical protein